VIAVIAVIAVIVMAGVARMWLVVALHWRAWRRRDTGLFGALDEAIEFAAVEPDAAALRAVIDLDALAVGHGEVHVVAGGAQHGNLRRRDGSRGEPLRPESSAERVKTRCMARQVVRRVRRARWPRPDGIGVMHLRRGRRRSCSQAW
jgi:hypothetical protein